MSRVRSGAQELKDTFFETPAQFIDAGSPDGLLRHLTDDLSNALDTHLVDDLRDFLVDPAINIERGRDLGLGTLNQTRIALRLVYLAACGWSGSMRRLAEYKGLLHRR